MVNIFKLETRQLKLLAMYKEILNTGSHFPKDFWSWETKGKAVLLDECRLLSRYCLENLCGIAVPDLPKYQLKEIKAMLAQKKLSGMIQTVFSNDILAILKNTYPEEFNSRSLKEWMWRKHGLWKDEKLISEAVRNMVADENITNIEDIPFLDWKKRLIKHGIYNTLAYFNWSIYSLFDFVYPGRFHPADFKYKAKWAAAESLENAHYYMDKIFSAMNFDAASILMLSTENFRKLGLAGMLASLFGSSALKAKEFYFYRTVDCEENQHKLKLRIKTLMQEKAEGNIAQKLKNVAEGQYIYYSSMESSFYNYIKSCAKRRRMSVCELISSFGYTYVTARKKSDGITPEILWSMRKQGLTYIQMAEKLGSNPTTISMLCKKYFGGDPLIPRPLEHYTTIQELMDRYRVDHKTIMKFVRKYKLENHSVIRSRYLKKSEIEPILENYILESRQHLVLTRRYAN